VIWPKHRNFQGLRTGQLEMCRLIAVCLDDLQVRPLQALVQHLVCEDLTRQQGHGARNFL
jgi:hypothetical protein